MGRSHPPPALSALALVGLSLLAAGEAPAEPPPPSRPAAVAPAAGPEPQPRPGPAAGSVPADGPFPCGTDIVAEPLPPIAEAGGCGVAAPVRVRSVAGVALDPPPVLACETARRLRDWLEADAKPAFASDGAPLTGLAVAAAYVCRNVNDAAEGDLSEHAFGRALDVSRFLRADGTAVSVLEHWGVPPHGDLLRRVHEDACGVFGTALGPDSDPLHADHFHYDVAERRRPFCPPDDPAQSAN